MSDATKRLQRAEILFLLLLTLLAFALRWYRVGSISLAEDEAHKWHAIQQYKQGRFVGVNSEHPMLMKILAWGTLEFGQRWNRSMAGRPSLRAAEEAWLRLPNLLLGALLSVLIYLYGKHLMGFWGAASAAFFWAVLPLPVAQNRILKEDTLLTLFILLGCYFYVLAKKASTVRGTRWLYVASGAAFGVSVASKYVFGLFGINSLAWYAASLYGLERGQPGVGKHLIHFLLAMGLAFVVFNPVILVPENVATMWQYVGEKTVTHHGYNLDGGVHINNASAAPFGLPWYFYAWVLGVKTPLPVLACFVLGVLCIIVRRRSLASVVLRSWMVILLLVHTGVGGKFIRYLLLLHPWICLAAGWGAATLLDWLRGWPDSPRRWVALLVAGLLLVVVPLAEAISWAPWYPLYLNPLGGGEKNVARFFPHDELYDLGLREALDYVCRVAPPGAAVASDNRAAVHYYLQRYGRADLRVMRLSDPQYVPRPGDFLLVQESRRYFETQDLFYLLARRGPPLKDVRVNGVLAVRVYRF